MELRPYQLAAFDATLQSLRNGFNPVIAIPTGGGKSAVAAALVDRFREKGGYTLLVTHSKELVVQNFNTLRRYSNVSGVGIFSSGLNTKKIGERATYGTIQTMYRNLHLWKNLDVRAIIVDECQLVAHKGSDTKMYNAMMDAFPEARRIGLSATPYRLDKGLVYKGEGARFDDLAIDIKVTDLVRDGYLSPLSGISASVQLDLNGVHRSNGDFDTKEVDERMTEAWLREVMSNVKRLAHDRKAILMFAPTVRVAEIAAKISCEIGISAEYVHGGDKEREDRISRWEAGQFVMMANCQILTTGYDRPDIDCIVDCSPTESLGKHIQKLGRGTRLFEGKKDCLVIDVAGNLVRLGGISAEADFMEEKPDGILVPGKVKKPVEKKPRAIKKANGIEALDPMMGNATEIKVAVEDVSYIIIPSHTQEGKELLMVEYEARTDQGHFLRASNFVCPEYTGYARGMAEEFFKRRGADTFPRTAKQAMIMCYGLPVPRHLTVKRNGKYINVIREHFEKTDA